MKILYDHQIVSWQRYGGISRYFSEIANEIANIERKVEIFAPLHDMSTSVKISRSGCKVSKSRNCSRGGRMVKVWNSITANLC